jgi:CheY-like chemotaxis protein
MGRTRVLLADDHPDTVLRWRALLEPAFDIVGTVADGEALVETAARLMPDVIVTDISMPELNGIAAAERIMIRHPAARIVFATMHADRQMLRRALAAGAFGYVLKVRVGEDLVPAVSAALRGELLISPFPPLRPALARSSVPDPDDAVGEDDVIVGDEDPGASHDRRAGVRPRRSATAGRPRGRDAASWSCFARRVEHRASISGACGARTPDNLWGYEQVQQTPIHRQWPKVGCRPEVTGVW